jgi:hypothetical protein
MPGNHGSPTTQESSKKPKKQPEKKIGPFANGIGACIWLNTIETENGSRTVRSISVNARRYFDRESGQWRDSPSYQPVDLPALIFSLQKALEFVFETPFPTGTNGEEEQQIGQTPGEEFTF